MPISSIPSAQYSPRRARHDRIRPRRRTRPTTLPRRHNATTATADGAADRQPYFRPTRRSARTWSSPTTRGGWSISTARFSARFLPACAGARRPLARRRWGNTKQHLHYRGHLFTDDEGRYRFRTILPALFPAAPATTTSRCRRRTGPASNQLLFPRRRGGEPPRRPVPPQL